ncbi:sugar transferase [Aeromicrobium duanguangcaii]|uniref:sugar transferase n=1 Tax=Aeromicrobium duanguangcaii TaxID=2968086 RepID=UPI002017CDBC|nr:sugar transferase [Aeromicrobium duanguangcaii]MCL3838566.1 sugar transferase [Aeromicrobium duanguangcaii]
MSSAIDGRDDVVLPLRLVEPITGDADFGSPSVHRELTAIPTGRSSVATLIRQGFFGHLVVLLGTVVAGVAVGLTPGTLVLVTLGVAVWLGFGLAALPAYERAGSLRPARRLLAVLALGALATLVVSDVISAELRATVVVLSVTAVLIVASALVHRAVMRRVPTLLVGPADAVNRLSARWEDRDDLVVVGRCTWDSTLPLGSATVNSVVRDVPKLLRTVRGARVVITADQALGDASLRHLAWGLQRAEVECLVLTDMNDYVEFVRPTRVGDQLALALDPPNSHLVGQATKAFFDRSMAVLAVVLGAPLMALIALAIRLDSAGPVIYRQERTGKDGVPFTIFKFRTMVVDADQRVEELRDLNDGSGPLFKMTQDPRVTRVGRLLRQTSLDELPQLFNVLLGDMALVGPRPALESETSQYSQWVWRRLHVKPGMTGLWQVSGRSTLSWDESIRLDLMYVNNWNLRMDFSILLKTIAVVVNRKGAW